jgi:hypothetical protein
LIHHLLHFFLNISPRNIFPLSDSVLNFGVQVVELVKEINLFFGFFKLWVRLMRKTEESLTSIVRDVLSLSDLILLRLHLKSVQSFFWLDTWNHRTLLIKVLSEKDNVVDKDSNTGDKSLFELRLLTLKIVSHLNRLLNKLFPILVDDGRWILVSFLVDLIVIQVVLKQVVHFNDRSEFNLNSRLLLSDFIKSVHHITERINILCRFLDLQFNVLDFFSELVNVGLGLLQKIFSISIFPLNDPLLESSLNVVSFQAQGTNLMMDHNEVDFILTLNELKELLLEIFKLRLFLVELSKFFVDLVFPEPVELLEALKELVNIVLSSLNGTGKKKDDLNNFLILGNPIVEWFSLVLRLILLVPVLNVLGGFKNVGSSSVNSTLDFFKGWLQDASVSI